MWLPNLFGARGLDTGDDCTEHMEYTIPFTSSWIQAARVRIPSLETDGRPERLDYLPSALLEQILSLLPGHMICRAGQSCKTLLFLCAEDSLWRNACRQQFGPHDRRSELGLRSYNSVYVALSATMQLQGYWQVLRISHVLSCMLALEKCGLSRFPPLCSRVLWVYPLTCAFALFFIPNLVHIKKGGGRRTTKPCAQ
jgi:hypothetical protein